MYVDRENMHVFLQYRMNKLKKNIKVVNHAGIHVLFLQQILTCTDLHAPRSSLF